MHGRHIRSHYTSLLSKVQRRIDGWKMNSLSLAGRIALAASVLSTMPVYQMQIAKLPQCVNFELDKYTRRCVWGSNNTTKRVHLVNWPTVCKRKLNGGPGLKQAGTMNKALIAKLAWRVVQEPHALWSQVIRSKYRQGRDLLNIFKSRPGVSHIWRSMVECVEEMGQMKWNIGDGSVIKFWMDSWFHDYPLRELALMPLPPCLLERTLRDYW